MSSCSETPVIPISRSIAGRPVGSTSRLNPQGHQDVAAVLVVDDEPKMLELRRHLLEMQGYVAIVAESGEKALIEAEEKKAEAAKAKAEAKAKKS